MDKASVYGTGDCRFESYQDHFWSVRIGFSLRTTSERHNFLYLNSRRLRFMFTSSNGVTVSTLDFESSDGGSNPPGTLFSE